MRPNYHPSRQEALTQCCSNVGSSSSTSAQHQNNNESMPRVSWDHIWSDISANGRLMLGQHLRRWPNIKTSLLHRFVLAGIQGGVPRVVVSTAAFQARARGSVLGLGGLEETKNVSSPSTCESQYCGEPPWPRGSVLGLRPPRLEFRILCLEDSVISIISPSSGGSPGPV